MKSSLNQSPSVHSHYIWPIHLQLDSKAQLSCFEFRQLLFSKDLENYYSFETPRFVRSQKCKLVPAADKSCPTSKNASQNAESLSISFQTWAARVLRTLGANMPSWSPERTEVEEQHQVSSNPMQISPGVSIKRQNRATSQFNNKHSTLGKIGGK